MSAFICDNLWWMMLISLGILLFSGLPVALVLAGVGLGFGFLGWGVDLVRLSDFGMIYYRIYGTLKDSGDALWSGVPLLLFMGLILQRCGVAQEMLGSLQYLLRKVPSSLAVAVILIGVILAPAAGMVGASVITLALIALPAMLEQGYEPSFASGSVAAAGALGVALPPGVMLFFLSESMGVFSPYVFLAMVGPSILLVFFYCTYCGAMGWFSPALAPRLSHPHGAECGPSMLSIFRSLALPIGLAIAILLFVTVGWVPLGESAAMGACGALLISLLRKSLSLRLLHQVIIQTAALTAMVFFIYMGASAFNLIFWLIGGISGVTGFLESLQLGSYGTLVLILLILFLLGFILDWIELVVVSFVMFRPAIDSLDFSGYVDPPMYALAWVTTLIAMTLQSSFLTPPFGYALFFLRGSAPKKIRMQDIYRGIVPFVVIQLMAIIIVASFPKVATWLPQHVISSEAPRKASGHSKI
ncbi:MAG: TRAP transporter large permease subunit [Hyphomicrobiales bacterium]